MAHIKTNTLLDFEFDGDDGAVFLGLQESFDVNYILSALKTEQQRTALRIAIEQYDVALRDVHDRVVSTYYYQPAAKFEQEEPKLVQSLEHAQKKSISW